MYSVGIDIGGTYIKAGLIKDQKLIVKDKIKTIVENNEDKIITELKSLINGLLAKVEEGKIQNIGIGIAGSSKNGVCLYSKRLNGAFDRVDRVWHGKNMQSYF